MPIAIGGIVVLAEVFAEAFHFGPVSVDKEEERVLNALGAAFLEDLEGGGLMRRLGVSGLPDPTVVLERVLNAVGAPSLGLEGTLRRVLSIAGRSAFVSFEELERAGNPLGASLNALAGPSLGLEGGSLISLGRWGGSCIPEFIVKL